MIDEDPGRIVEQLLLTSVRSDDADLIEIEKIGIGPSRAGERESGVEEGVQDQSPDWQLDGGAISAPI
jgi:hypothetical protein